MHKKVYIFHHNDLDGRTAGAIIYKALQVNLEKQGTLDEYVFSFHEINYTKVIDTQIEDGHIFVFVDYSFSNIENANYLKRLIDAGNKILWIDHHKTSVEMLSDIVWSETLGLTKDNIEIHIDTDHCAAYWCYKYGVEACGSQFDEEKVPELIKYIDAYDTWNLDSMENILEFECGVHFLGVRPQLWIDEILGQDVKPYAIFKPNAVQISRMKKYITESIKTGTLIRKYESKNNKYLVSTKGFNFYLNDYRNMLDVKQYSGFAVNGRGNSSFFGDEINKYDIVCLFSFDGTVWKYSFYTNKDDVDVSLLCKILGYIDSFGGGGHAQAAGFQTTDLILNDKCSIDIFQNKFNKQRYTINVSSCGLKYKLTIKEKI
jgi:oligoribonuclease NrnB/cAMP/cGMP phosphodiesterase (DHH superfamily)